MAGYLGSVPVPQATQHRESFTCTAGQTTFNTAGYTPQFIDVYLNGVHLSPADVTATNGSDVVLAACLVNDIVDVVSYTPFEVANQTFTGTTTMDVVAIGGATTIATNKKLIFRDAAIHISSTADGDMSIAADDEIDITSTLIDVNGNLDVSGTTVTAGNLSVGSGTPAYVLDVEGATSGDWLAHLYNSHATNGYGLKVKAGDNEDVTSFRVSTQANTTLMNVYGNGMVTMPLQPAFSVNKGGTNQDNLAIGSDVTITFDTERFDNNADFNLGANSFTAPVTGKYMLSLSIRFNNVDSAAAYVLPMIITSNEVYRFIFDPDFGQDAAYWNVAFSVLADMDASDTATISYNQGGGTQQIDVSGDDNYTYFTGYLVA